ncbi:MAG TPA: FtsX-like permease family protein [Mycobacteriales bacterium]
MTAILTWLRLDLRRRWRSLAFLALLVALAAGTVLASTAGARRGGSAFERLKAETLPATIVVLPNQPGFDWEPIRALPEVEALSRFPVSYFDVEGIPTEDHAAAFPIVDADAPERVERPVVLAGRLPDQSKVDEVLASVAFLKGHDKKIGDTVTLVLGTPEQAEHLGPGGKLTGPRQQVRIVGIGRSPWVLDMPGSKGGVEATAAFFARYRANLVGANGSIPINAFLRLRAGPADIPRFKADLARISGRTDIDIWDTRDQFAAIRRTTDFERTALLAFAGAVLAAATFLIGQSIARSAASAVTEAQVLRALGLTPRQAVLIGSAGSAIACAAGCVLGAAAAYVASAKFPIATSALVEPHPGLRFDPAVLLGGTALLVLLAAGGSMGAAWSAQHRVRSGVVARRSVVATAAARLGLPVPVVVGSRFALEPGRGRAAVPVRPALVGAVAGVLGVLAAVTFQAGVSDAVGNPERFGQTYQATAFVGFNGQEPPGVAEALSKSAADPDVTAVNDARVDILSIGSSTVEVFTYAPVGGKPLPTVAEAGRLPQAPDELALAPTSLRSLGLKVGQTVDVVGAHGIAGRLRISGSVYVPSGPHNGYADGGWMLPTTYDRLFLDPKTNKVGFKYHFALASLRDGADVGAFAARVQKATRGTDEEGIAWEPPEPIEAIQQITSVRQLPLLLGGFLALLAIGAVGHALATAVRRRRHDVAVLRALGLTRGQARLTVVVQASLLAVVGLLFGVPLGLALGRTVWRVVADNTPVFYVPPLAALALLLIAPAALLLVNLLAAWPGHRAARLRIGHALRAE